MSKSIVVLSIIIQTILVVNLANEVFVQELVPSNGYLPLRVVLLGFISALFNAEQTSVTKSHYFVSLGKIGYTLTIMNFLR